MDKKALSLYVSTIIWVVTSVFSIATAGIIENTDNDSFIDNATGLEWMDFGINNGQSFDYVSSQLASGGIYKGWQLATESQVYEMWANAFLGLDSSFENQNFFGVGQLKVVDGKKADGSIFSPIFAAMGFNTIIDPYLADTKASKGLFEGQNGLSFVESRERVGMYNNWLDDDISQIIENNNNEMFRESGDIQYSTMLVKVLQVTEPSTFIIFTLGLIGIGFRQFNRRI
jgi:hypothetical protein